jgi:transcription termination factor NusB
MKLFIARVEVYHPKNFVASTFQRIGRVNSIEYIPKIDFNGNDYYSAIIEFSTWIMSEDTNKLFNELSSTNTTEHIKYYYTDKRGQVKYWIVKEYIEELQKGTQRELRDIQKEISESHDCQMTYYRLRNITLERQLVEMNSTEITQRLQIDYLNHRLTEAEIVKETVKIRDMDLSYMQEENKKLKEELEMLRRDVRDRDRMIEYYETGI